MIPIDYLNNGLSFRSRNIFVFWAEEMECHEPEMEMKFKGFFGFRFSRSAAFEFSICERRKFEFSGAQCYIRQVLRFLTIFVCNKNATIEPFGT